MPDRAVHLMEKSWEEDLAAKLEEVMRGGEAEEREFLCKLREHLIVKNGARLSCSLSV